MKDKKELVLGICLYLARIGIALSVLFNVLTGGYSNQTFSARNYSWKRKGYPNIVPVIDWLFCVLIMGVNLITERFGVKFDCKDHCLKSWVYWVTRKSVNVEYAEDIKICQRVDSVDERFYNKLFKWERT